MIPRRKANTAASEVPTWRELLPDYVAPPLVITRAEVLAVFARERVPLTERTLRYWESVGALPRPVRQQHEGAVQAVYPAWSPRLVAVVGVRRDAGESLASIAADMPRLVQGHATMFWAVENNYFVLQDFRPDLLPPLRALADQVSKATRPVTEGLIHLFDAERKPALVILPDPQ